MDFYVDGVKYILEEYIGNSYCAFYEDGSVAFEFDHDGVEGWLYRWSTGDRDIDQERYIQEFDFKTPMDLAQWIAAVGE